MSPDHLFCIFVTMNSESNPAPPAVPEAPAKPLLQARNIVKSYGQLQVLKGVDLSLAEGEIVTLVGASGAGKSTLLQILGTLDDPDRGEIEFGGQDVLKMRASAKAAFRNTQLGFVFQFHYLLPEFNALENIALPAYIAGQEKEAANKRASELLAYFGLSDRETHKPGQLSGGEQQRVAVARALVNSPRLILADEPTGNLDSVNSENLYQLFTQLAREMGIGFLITTHNENLAQAADRCLRMRDGQVLDQL